MAELTWDGLGEKFYETGVSCGVLYKKKTTSSGGTTTTDPYGNAYPWNGLISVNESPEGGDANDIYADDVLYASIRGTEKFKASVECYTYPDAFAECIGEATAAPGVFIGGQIREPFGFAFKSLIGNDEDGLKEGYKLHLIYGCTASPSEKSYETLNDSPDAGTFSFDFDTVPIKIDDGTTYQPTSHITIDSRTADPTKIKALEALIFGATATDARLPLPDEVIDTLS